jgi:arsenite-transporting ATPase
VKLPLYRTDPAHTTRYLFFTGKGGVGKTSLSCATALKLAEAGKRVLLVSTAPASNLDEVLETTLTKKPTPIASVPQLDAMNINPVEAAKAYRERLIGTMRGLLPEATLI